MPTPDCASEDAVRVKGISTGFRGASVLSAGCGFDGALLAIRPRLGLGLGKRVLRVWEEASSEPSEPVSAWEGGPGLLSLVDSPCVGGASLPCRAGTESAVVTDGSGDGRGATATTGSGVAGGPVSLCDWSVGG